MDTKSCGSHAMAKAGCQHKQGCSRAAAEKNIGDAVIWIVAVDARTVHVFLQRPGQSIEPLSMGCCCSKEISNLENLAKYLDTALICGDYAGLVLVGPEAALKTLKSFLSAAVHNRVIAEIIDDIAGKSAHEVAQSIAARMAA